MSSDKVTYTILPNGNLRITIPMVIKKTQGRKMIYTPEGVNQKLPDSSSRTQSPMVRAIARAYAWAELIETGKVKSTVELAKKLNVSSSYITKILKLSTLAPDIVEAIFEGKEPAGMSLTKLCQPFPMEWEKQREKFGFPPKEY